MIPINGLTSDSVPAPDNRPASCVSDPLAAEEAIHRLQEDLIAQNRLALLGAASAMLAHEFNNLMTPVMAYATEAVARVENGFARKAFEQVIRQTDRALGITRKLLALAGGEPVQPAAHALAPIVRDAITAAVRPFEKDAIRLTVDVPEHIRVHADATLLEQVLLNLLLQARDAMHRGGGVAEVRAGSDGRVVHISVAHSGVCWSPREIDERVNPFLSSDVRERPWDWVGVGVGLNVCRLITQSHGGTISMLPREQGGCTCRITWPAASQAGDP